MILKKYCAIALIMIFSSTTAWSAYELKSLTNSFGTMKMIDIKGQAVIGYSEDTGIGVGLGGINNGKN